MSPVIEPHVEIASSLRSSQWALAASLRAKGNNLGGRGRYKVSGSRDFSSRLNSAGANAWGLAQRAVKDACHEYNIR